MFLGWVAQGQVCSKKPPASREVLSPGFGMRWDNLWLKPRWILWNLMVKSWFPVDFPLNQSVEAYTSFCARNLMSNSSNVASWWVSLMILQLHYDPYMPCYPGIAVDVDLAKREMWTATHMVALWSWDILDITYIYIYDYICIYHIVTKEGDSLRLGGSRLAQHYLLDRSFQALTELSLRSGEKKAGAVGMSRVIACHTKEVLMHSKHTWYSYGIHMVFIWYPMKERGTKMLCETGRGEIHAQTLGLSGRIPGNWCSQSQLFISFGFCTFCTASIITSIDWGNKLRNSLAAF